MTFSWVKINKNKNSKSRRSLVSVLLQRGKVKEEQKEYTVQYAGELCPIITLCEESIFKPMCHSSTCGSTFSLCFFVLPPCLPLCVCVCLGVWLYCTPDQLTHLPLITHHLQYKNPGSSTTHRQTVMLHQWYVESWPLSIFFCKALSYLFCISCVHLCH